MDPLSIQRMTSVGPRIDEAAILIRLVAAFALGLLVALAYRRAQRNVAQSHKLVGSLVMLSMIVAVVLMVIDSSLARAFGLVGALAIIRFRTPVKDMTDIIYLFLAIGAGIACGAGQLGVAFLGVPAVLLAGAVVRATGLDRGGSARSLLIKLVIAPNVDAPRVDAPEAQGADAGAPATGTATEAGAPADPDAKGEGGAPLPGGENALVRLLDEHCTAYQLLELLSIPDGPQEVMYDIQLTDTSDPQQLVALMTRLPGVERVVLLGAPHELDIR